MPLCSLRFILMENDIIHENPAADVLNLLPDRWSTTLELVVLIRMVWWGKEETFPSNCIGIEHKANLVIKQQSRTLAYLITWVSKTQNYILFLTIRLLPSIPSVGVRGQKDPFRTEWVVIYSFMVPRVILIRSLAHLGLIINFSKER